MPTADQTARAVAAAHAYLKTQIEAEAPFIIKSQAEEGLESDRGRLFVVNLVATILKAAGSS